MGVSLGCRESRFVKNAAAIILPFSPERAGFFRFLGTKLTFFAIHKSQALELLNSCTPVSRLISSRPETSSRSGCSNGSRTRK